MANTIGSFARQGRRVKSDPMGLVMMSIWAGIGLSIVVGLVLAVWRGLGSRVASTAGNVGRGVVQLGTTTVEQGAGFDVDWAAGD